MGVNRFDYVIPEKTVDESMTWDWGTVQEGGEVLLDKDQETPLPAEISSLTQLYPNQRVAVDRQGRNVRVVGALAQPSTFPAGESADDYTLPGNFPVRDGSSATLSSGFPLDGVSGWLEVLGDSQMVLQRYTTYGGHVYQRRYGAGSWNAWKRIDNQPYVPPPAPTWETATLANGWTNYTSFGSLEYRLEGDVVRFRGVVRNGTVGSSTPITTLPPSCRPSSTRLCLASSGGTGVDLRVSSAGGVYVNSGSFMYVSLEGVSFAL